MLMLIAELVGCDKPDPGPRGSSDSNATSDPLAAADSPAPAKATAPSTPASGDPELVTPTATPTIAPAPPPEPAPPPPESEFDALLVRVSGLPEPRRASEPSVDEVSKTAWAHYKARRYEGAAREFARLAARDSTWKPAHNLACASAKLGQLDDARVALAESFARGGEAAKASAKKDSDLVEVRAQPWFDALLTGAAKPSTPTLDPSDADDDDDDDDDDGDDDDEPNWVERSSWPPSCPPDLKSTDDHWCWTDVIATFTFAEVVFDKPITLDLEVPAMPASRPWAPAKGKISMKDVRAELGIAHTTEAADAYDVPEVMAGDGLDPLEDEGFDTKPFFWWPDPSAPILVMLQRQKLGKMRFYGVILARKSAKGWQATNLEVVKASQDPSGSNADLESGIGFRVDGLELFTISQQAWSFDRDIPAAERWLCRIRWDQGKLVRGCVDQWTTFDP